MDERYFSVKEVAERFKVSRQAVYDWITDGRLRAIKIGNRTRIAESAIETFVRVVAPGEQLDMESDE